MKKQGILIILTIVIAMMTQITPAVGDYSSIIQVSAKNIYMTAGQENTITIVLSNIGDYKIHNVECFLSSTTLGLTVITKANNVFHCGAPFSITL